MIRRALLIAAAVCAVGSAVSLWWLMIVAVALYGVAEIFTIQIPGVRRVADADQTSVSLILTVATAVVVIRHDAPAFEIWEVAILLAFLHAAQFLRHVLRILVARRWSSAVQWRNLGVGLGQPHRILGLAGTTILPIPIWLAAPACAVFGAPPTVLIVIGIAAAAWAIATLVPISAIILHNLRLPPEPARVDGMLEALRTAAPEILVHFNGAAASGYTIAQWIDVLEQLDERHRVVILVVDRQPWHLDTTISRHLPVLYLQGAEAIELLVQEVPSIIVALYPRNTAPNKNLLRVPGLYDVLVGHGESDKAEEANPAARAFDEIWVAGEAARDRFLAADIGVHEEQLRIVGRPQLGELLAARDAGTAKPTRKTVVYAPTWEGYFAADGYSSVLELGERIVSALLARDDLTLIYAPHPALGSADRLFTDAATRIAAHVRRAGGPHRIVASFDERYAAFVEADLMVTDVGADLIDFLALDRPYVVINPSEASTQAFLSANPSARGGVVVAPDQVDSLAGVVADAIATDELRDERHQVTNHYLGDLVVPPVDFFLARVDDCLELVRTSRPRSAEPGRTESALS